MQAPRDKVIFPVLEIRVETPATQSNSPATTSGPLDCMTNRYILTNQASLNLWIAKIMVSKQYHSCHTDFYDLDIICNAGFSDI